MKRRRMVRIHVSIKDTTDVVLIQIDIITNQPTQMNHNAASTTPEEPSTFTYTFLSNYKHYIYISKEWDTAREAMYIRVKNNVSSEDMFTSHAQPKMISASLTQH